MRPASRFADMRPTGICFLTRVSVHGKEPWMSLHAHAASALQRASSKTAADLTHKVRSDAMASGWPSHLVSALSVSHQEGSFRVDWPEHLHESVLDWEHGTQNRQPTGVLTRAQDHIYPASKAFDAEAMSYLHAAGVL